MRKQEIFESIVVVEDYISIWVFFYVGVWEVFFFCSYIVEGRRVEDRKRVDKGSRCRGVVGGQVKGY